MKAIKLIPHSFLAVLMVMMIGCEIQEPFQKPQVGPDSNDVSTAPWRMMPAYAPSGLWDGNSCGDCAASMAISQESRKWENSYLNITYTVGSAGWAGLSVLPAVESDPWNADPLKVDTTVDSVSFRFRGEVGSNPLQFSISFFPEVYGGDTTMASIENHEGDGQWHDTTLALNPPFRIDTISIVSNISFNANGNSQGTDLALEIEDVLFH